MQETLLTVIRADIVKKSRKIGQRVRWANETAYEIDKSELEEYARQLAADLEKAAEEDLVPDVLDDDTATDRDPSDEETEPTRIGFHEDPDAVETCIAQSSIADAERQLQDEGHAEDDNEDEDDEEEEEEEG